MTVLIHNNDCGMKCVLLTVTDAIRLSLLTVASVPIGHQLSPRQSLRHTPLAGTIVQLCRAYHLPRAYTACDSLTSPPYLWCTTASYTLAMGNSESYS
jgi:hypothetical protein